MKSSWLGDNCPLIGIAICLALVIGIVFFGYFRINDIIVNEVVPKIELTIKCIEYGYVGLDYVNNHPVCYGYVEGNQLVVKQVSELERYDDANNN